MWQLHYGGLCCTVYMCIFFYYRATHCTKHNLNLCQNTASVTSKADATVFCVQKHDVHYCTVNRCIRSSLVIGTVLMPILTLSLVQCTS